MKVLIKDLLDFSRIGAKGECVKIDCNLVVTNVLTDLMIAIKEAKAVIKYDELPVIDGYPSEIKALFQNLIINAIKFRKKDRIPQINITATTTNNDYQFSFKDNGIGMEKHNTEKIFNIF